MGRAWAAVSCDPLPLDHTEWGKRFKTLSPIKICPIMPNEAAPYPSCLGAEIAHPTGGQSVPSAFLPTRPGNTAAAAFAATLAWEVRFMAPNAEVGHRSPPPH